SAGLTFFLSLSWVLKWASRRSSRYCRGVRPSTARKARSNRCGVVAALALSVARLAGASGRASINRQTERTSATRGSAGLAAPGWQRRQARNPARSAASGTGKNATYTVGHSTRSLETFRGLLAQHRVRLLVDVRRYPASRRYPHFAQEPLAAALAAAGIAYRHDVDLGGRRPAREDSPNTAWRSAAFRGYADYMETAAFEQALARLIVDA